MRPETLLRSSLCAIMCMRNHPHGNPRESIFMTKLTIYQITTVLRGFSNQVTVERLSADLGISYSTLARCKNGKWPRSITFRAIKNAFSTYRDEFFGGSSKLIVEDSLSQLQHLGCDTTKLAEAYAQGGFDAFVSALMLEASREND